MKQEMNHKITNIITNLHSLEYLNIKIKEQTSNSRKIKRDNKRKKDAVDANRIILF